MGFKTRKIPRDLLLDPPPRRRRWWLLPAILLAGLALLLVTIDVRADAFSEAESGQLLIKDVSGWQQAVHLETSVNIMVTGIVARTTMRQSFRNDSESWQDAVYVFPLPDSAAIFDMEMHIGERIIRSRIREREQARKIYREAEAEGRKAALTEQQRPNLFTQSIANIQPGEAIEVILVYIETVRYDNGRFSLRLPLTLTPRYIPGHAAAEYLGATSPGWAPPTDQVPDAPEITPHMHPPATETAIINPVSINITLDTGLVIADISSPYHEIDVTRQTGIHRIVLFRHPMASRCRVGTRGRRVQGVHWRQRLRADHGGATLGSFRLQDLARGYLCRRHFGIDVRHLNCPVEEKPACCTGQPATW
jgi:Ca-activated chloride channel family protein